MDAEENDRKKARGQTKGDVDFSAQLLAQLPNFWLNKFLFLTSILTLRSRSSAFSLHGSQRPGHCIRHQNQKKPSQPRCLESSDQDCTSLHSYLCSVHPLPFYLQDCRAGCRLGRSDLYYRGQCQKTTVLHPKRS